MKSEFTEGQKALILKYLLGGLAIGAGSNLALNMISYLKDKSDNIDYKNNLASNANILQEIEVDPDALKNSYKKASSNPNPGVISNSLALALAMLGAAGGIYTGYKAGDFIHDTIKNKELEDEEQKELNAYYSKLYLLNQLSKGSPKFASEKTAAVSDILGGILGTILLSSLATAIVSRKVFKKQFPLNQKLLNDKLELEEEKFGFKPKFIVFKEKQNNTIPDKSKTSVKSKDKVIKDSDIEKDSNEIKDPNETLTIDNEDAFSKAFSKLSYENCNIDCNEALLKVEFNLEKQGKKGSATNLIKAAALGFTKELEDSLNIKGNIFEVADTLSNNLKFASDEKFKDIKDQLAITWLASNKKVANEVMPQIAAEFQYNAPFITKIASFIPERLEPMLNCLLISSVIKDRTDLFNKYASEISDTFADIKLNTSNDINDLSNGLQKLLNNFSKDSFSQELQKIFYK